MAVILNIETSAERCSVALSNEGQVVWHAEEETPMKHAERLAPYVSRALDDATRREMRLDAVAVSIGPGSYTGLRIGLSLTKGLCYGLDIPLITVPTLELLAVSAMFRNMDAEGDEIYVPMLDARRMEVYTATYDAALTTLQEPRPLILEQGWDTDIAPGRKLICVGNGATKAEPVAADPSRILFMPRIMPLAMDMTALSERAFRQGTFADTAYTTPLYLKDFQATTPKNLANTLRPNAI